MNLEQLPDWLTVDNFNKIALALVAIFAALSGPILTWFITSRQLKTQEIIAKRQVADSIGTKRQVWIDGLRGEISDFLYLSAQVIELAESSEGEKGTALPDGMVERINSLLRESTHVRLKIELRLNGAEAGHVTLIERLDEISDIMFGSFQTGKFIDEDDKAKKAFQACLIHSRNVLKEEWERVKRDVQ